METAEKLITENLDVWTSAVKTKSSAGRGTSNKRMLYGAKKLRELILELAVRGLLIAQNPNDEPTARLLKDVAAERARLIAVGKIKKKKAAPRDPSNELQLALPPQWGKAALADLGEFRGGKTPSKNNPAYWGGEIPWVTPKDMKPSAIEGAEDQVTQLAVDDGLAIHEPESILFVVRSGILRRLLPVAISRIDCTVNQDLKVLNPYKKELSPYLALMCKGFERHILQSLTKTGTTVESIVFEKFSSHRFPIPPLAEQHRIVAKVDDLMALCDQLEQEQESSLETHDTLVITLLGALTSASAQGATFAEAWQRIQANFDTLFTTESSIDQLKQTILQLAVMGKLVPQDPKDEPAVKLLARIAAERTGLINSKLIRKPKEMIELDELPRPFGLSKKWRWVRLGELCYVVADGPHFSPKYVDKSEGVTFLSMRNVSVDNIDLSSAKYVSQADHETFCKRVKVKKGDVLYTKGGTTGVAKVNDLDIEFSVWVHLAVLQIPNDKLCNEYVALALNSPHCFKQSQEYTNGIGNKDLGLTRMINITLPLPPLEEQHRIVAKVDELMALCEQLKARFATAQTTQLYLADSLVKEAVK